MYVDWFNFASTSFTGGGFLMSDKWRFSTSFALLEKNILVPYDKCQRLLKNVATEPETKKNSSHREHSSDQIEKPIHWIEYK
jgi:hypothetical protein